MATLSKDRDLFKFWSTCPQDAADVGVRLIVRLASPVTNKCGSLLKQFTIRYEVPIGFVCRSSYLFNLCK
jgi:hypothetical protein